jgi:hypothetical protein
MDSSGYEIIPYRPELRPQVVSLMQYLWGKDIDGNRAYFKWKYEDNPYTESPLGIVGLKKGAVVGFRGYFATRFQVGERNDSLIVLFPGDTCVHPNHRRKGLSVIMGNLAMEEYALRSRLFFNTTCTRNSLPGYQKMGFFPLTPKFYLTRCPHLGLLQYIPAAHESLPLSASRVRFGRFDNILVSSQPKPEAMSSLVAGRIKKGGTIRLFQDEDFFRWRFCSPLNKYVFYYWMEEDRTTGFVVMGISPNNRRGYILDYAENAGSAIEEILKYVIEARPSNLLSIYDFCLEDTLRHTVKGLGFKTHGLVRIIEKNFTVSCLC